MLLKLLSDPKEAATMLAAIGERTNNPKSQEARHTVDTIIKQVRLGGDQALKHYTEKFDGAKLEELRVPPEEIQRAWQLTAEPLQEALQLAKTRIKTFHAKQLPADIDLEGPHGEKMRRRWRAVERAGLYVPGGRASYPSTVLMNAIPAEVAGVKHRVMVTPPGPDGQINSTVLAAAHLAGIDEIYRVGGAQAIAALAWGTESIPRVDVISGPGNLYVTLAKKALFGRVGIDSLAGPSEVLIIADDSADPILVAADLLAQAEHDPLAAAILLTTSERIARAVPVEVEKQLQDHPRRELTSASIRDWGLVVLCQSIEEAAKLSDSFAPEHLELQVCDPDTLAERIQQAGAIFLGSYTPEAAGDYLAGPNHTLPTSGTARFSGALSVETFMRHTSLIEFNHQALQATGTAIMALAASEGLHSHRESVRLRIEHKT
ncbi:histidinol dehydrogenase [Synechococcus sp. UW140]|uniref:histidinol dehydrogenase n=1 Tax=Synechococcus sp. UW140 TaxID=368503 RepID=UPI0025FA82AE|nr:histidinol dehydrogenase [Synechococcus sp. UW140]